MGRTATTNRAAHRAGKGDVMSTTTTHESGVRAETLVAMEMGRTGDIARVLAFVGDALVEHVETTTAHWRTGEAVVTHRVTFDARRVRNTEVHGASFHAGFVSHIE